LQVPPDRSQRVSCIVPRPVHVQCTECQQSHSRSGVLDNVPDHVLSAPNGGANGFSIHEPNHASDDVTDCSTVGCADSQPNCSAHIYVRFTNLRDSGEYVLVNAFLCLGFLNLHGDHGIDRLSLERTEQPNLRHTAAGHSDMRRSTVFVHIVSNSPAHGCTLSHTVCSTHDVTFHST
jgi:hypothetical protein